MANIKLSKLHLVDLAGSERQKDTHAQDVRLKVYKQECNQIGNKEELLLKGKTFCYT